MNREILRYLKGNKKISLTTNSATYKIITTYKKRDNIVQMETTAYDLETKECCAYKYKSYMFINYLLSKEVI